MKRQLLINNMIEKRETLSEKVAGKETEYSFYEISLSSGAKFFAVGIEDGSESSLSVVGSIEDKARDFFFKMVSNLVTPCTLCDIVHDNLSFREDNLDFTNWNFCGKI